MGISGRAWCVMAVGVWLVVQAAPAQAELNAQGRKEVSALLAFVGHSECRFIRNGTSYDAPAARAHMQTKLDYLERRGLVNSAEDFIVRAGSKSSFSGRPYKVSCAGHEQLSSDWLRRELLRLRQPTP